VRRRVDPSRAHVACACGPSFTLAGWRALERVGEYVDDLVRLDMRHCSACGSTLSLATARVRVTYSVEPVEGGRWIIWRRAGAGEAVAVGIRGRPTLARSEREAEVLVEVQRRALRGQRKRRGAR
jgi:hypothetical protein